MHGRVVGSYIQCAADLTICSFQGRHGQAPFQVSQAEGCSREGFGKESQSQCEIQSSSREDTPQEMYVKEALGQASSERGRVLWLGCIATHCWSPDDSDVHGVLQWLSETRRGLFLVFRCGFHCVLSYQFYWHPKTSLAGAIFWTVVLEILNSNSNKK